MERALQEAYAYLNGNAALREALGACESAELIPHYLGEGEHNLNFWFDMPSDQVQATQVGLRKYVLRINVATQPFHTDQVAYEYGALKALEPSGVTPRALYLDDGPDAPRKGALVIGFCEGEQLDFDNLHPGDLGQVAHIMACVHTVGLALDCPVYRPPDPMKALFDECVDRYEIYRSSGFAEQRIVRWVERFLAEAEERLQGIPQAPVGCIVNTEPLPSHFLLVHTGADGKATYGSFVDWERPIVGDPAQDVAFFASPAVTFWDSKYMMDPDEAAAFVETSWNAVDGRLSRDGFDKRLRAWRSLTALRSITWCCRATANLARDPHAHVTEKARRKMPVYLSDEFMEHLARA